MFVVYCSVSGFPAHVIRIKCKCIAAICANIPPLIVYYSQQFPSFERSLLIFECGLCSLCFRFSISYSTIAVRKQEVDLIRTSPGVSQCPLSISPLSSSYTICILEGFTTYISRCNCTARCFSNSCVFCQ